MGDFIIEAGCHGGHAKIGIVAKPCIYSNMRSFNQNGFTKITLSTTVNIFVEENKFLFTRLSGHDSFSSYARCSNIVNHSSCVLIPQC